MVSINRIPMTVTGNTNEIKYGTSSRGVVFANFSVAQTESILTQSTGKWEDGATTWIRCPVAGTIAEHMRASGMIKGVHVTVTGWYAQRSYETETHEKRTVFELNATDVAASLRYATVAISKVQTSNGFAGASADSRGQAPAGDGMFNQEYADAPMI